MFSQLLWQNLLSRKTTAKRDLAKLNFYMDLFKYRKLTTENYSVYIDLNVSYFNKQEILANFYSLKNLNTSSVFYFIFRFLGEERNEI